MTDKTINFGWCPRCKSDFPMMTKIIDGVTFCHLCGCDLQESKTERQRWVRWAKDYAKEL